MSEARNTLNEGDRNASMKQVANARTTSKCVETLAFVDLSQGSNTALASGTALVRNAAEGRRNGEARQVNGQWWYDTRTPASLSLPERLS